jgi:hypothetical protein
LTVFSSPVVAAGTGASRAVLPLEAVWVLPPLPWKESAESWMTRKSSSPSVPPLACGFSGVEMTVFTLLLLLLLSESTSEVVWEIFLALAQGPVFAAVGDVALDDVEVVLLRMPTVGGGVVTGGRGDLLTSVWPSRAPKRRLARSMPSVQLVDASKRGAIMAVAALAFASVEAAFLSWRTLDRVLRLLPSLLRPLLLILMSLWAGERKMGFFKRTRLCLTKVHERVRGEKRRALPVAKFCFGLKRVDRIPRLVFQTCFLPG